MLLRDLFAKCALFCLVMSFSSFSFADNGYWIQPNPELPSSLNKQVGSTTIMNGKICAMKRIDSMTLQCGAIKDKNVQVFATFPDELNDVSEQIVLQKNASDWSYQFTTPVLAQDGNNTLTIIVGKFDKETRALLRTKARLQNTLLRIEQNIQALDPLKKNYQRRLAYFQSRKTLIQEVITSIEENIDRNPDVLARYSRPLMVGGVVNGQHSHASSFNHYKLAVSSDKGAYLAGESAQIWGSVMLTKETKHTNGMNGRIEFKLNNSVVGSESGVQLSLNIPRSIVASIPGLVAQANPVELSFYNAREKIRVALPFELLVSNGTQNPMPIARIAANKAEALTGEAIQFNAQGSSAGVGSIIDYTIDFGDGTISSGTNSSWSHSYASQGIYTARLTVTDSELNKSSATTQITVTEPVSTSGPLANFTYKVEPETGELVTFFQGRPGDAAIVSARYTTSDGQSADVAEIIWRRYNILNLNPNMSVTLTVTDANGKTDSKTHVIIPESTPVVHLYWKDLGSRKAFFDFRDSFDTIDEIAGFEIDYGDGTITNFEFVDKLALHTYPAAGTYTVRLTAANYDDVEVSRTFQVTVTDLILPLAAPIASYEIGFPQNSNNVTFYLNQSIALSGSIVSVRWDYGDGTSYFGNDIIHAHYYDPGAYLATLTITDSNGNVSSQTQRIIIEDAGAPFIAGFFCNDTGGVGQISCESYVYDRDKDISEITVAWGDGTTQDIPVTNPEWMFILETNHTYQFAGTYSYTMTVKTNRGEEVSYSGIATVSGEVPNQAPVASVYCYSNDLNVTCDASSSYDPDGLITQYQWDMGDGNVTNSGNFFSHTYAQPGAYTVSLTILDNIGLPSTVSTLVNPSYSAPLPWIDISCSSQQPLVVRCSASASTFDGNLSQIAYSIGEENFSEPDLYYQFPTFGTKTIRAQITDSLGRVAFDENVMELSGEMPKAFAGFECTQEFSLVTVCDGNGSSSEYGVISSYEWKVDGVVKSTEAVFNLEVDAPETKVVTLKVVNSYGQTSQEQKEIQILQIDEPQTDGKFYLADKGQGLFESLDRTFVIRSELEEIIFSSEGNILVSLNDTNLQLSAENYVENGLDITNFVKDGLNHFVITASPTPEVYLTSDIYFYAGSRSLALNASDGVNLAACQVQFGISDSGFPITALSNAENENTILNVPKTNAFAFTSCGSKLYFGLIDAHNETLLMEPHDFSNTTTENNDFSNGLAGWDVQEGDAQTIQSLGAVLNKKTNLSMRLNHNSNGEIKVLKRFNSSSDDNSFELMARNGKELIGDFSIHILRDVQNGLLRYSLDVSGENREGFGQLKIKNLDIEGSRQYELLVFNKKQPAIEEGYSANFDKLMSWLVPNSWAQQNTSFDGMDLHQILSSTTHVKVNYLSDRRDVPLAALSIGYYHPYNANYSTDNQLKIGANKLYLRNLQLNIAPNELFKSFELVLINPFTGTEIHSVPLDKGMKIPSIDGVPFRVYSGNTANGKVAFLIKSNELPYNKFSSYAYVALKTSTDGVSFVFHNFSPFLRNNDADVSATTPESYSAKNGPFTILISMKDFFYKQNDTGNKLTPEEFNEYLKFRMPDDWLEDHRMGGDDFVSLDYAARVFDLIGSEFRLGDRVMSFKYNDMSVMNGGRFSTDDPSQRKFHHRFGLNVDFNFVDTEGARLFPDDHKMRTDHREVPLLLSLIGDQERQIYSYWKGLNLSSTAVPDGFSAAVYSTCHGDRLASDLLFSESKHGNHGHIIASVKGNKYALETHATRYRYRPAPDSEKPTKLISLKYDTTKVGVYKINGLEEGFTYRWFFEGDDDIKKDTIPGVLYPIKLLGDDKAKIVITGTTGTLTMGKLEGTRKSISISVMPIWDSAEQNRKACTAPERVSIEDPQINGYYVWGDPEFSDSSRVFFRPTCSSAASSPRLYGYNNSSNDISDQKLLFSPATGSNTSDFTFKIIEFPDHPLFYDPIINKIPRTEFDVNPKYVLHSGNSYFGTFNWISGNREGDPVFFEDCLDGVWLTLGDSCDELKISRFGIYPTCGSYIDNLPMYVKP